jgi:hypothetical protein
MAPGRKSGALAVTRSRRANFRSLLAFLLLALSPFPLRAQAVPYARSFAKPKDQIEQALKDLQAYSGQKLPALDGFVAVADKPLEHFERGFYQFSIELLPGDAGATIVRLTAKITAWYADRDVAKSGYQLLPSNGRLELDLLDHLEEKLSGKTVSPNRSSVQAPRPKLDLSGVPASSLPSTAPDIRRTPDEVTSLQQQREASEKHVQSLTKELQGLNEIQKNQAHPQNLVIIRKSGTPVYSKGSETARILFQTSENDEFEFLDGDSEWIHVSISGDSRGYLSRNSVELPERIAAKLQSPAVNPEDKFVGFRIEREETSTFPGDWARLKGKTVKIYTVQPVSQNPKDSGPTVRLNYCLVLFEKGYNEAASANPSPDGVVVIFDSADGGLAGATLADIQKISSGAITREAFWSQSYLDPPEAFRPPAHP